MTRDHQVCAAPFEAVAIDEARCSLIQSFTCRHRHVKTRTCFIRYEHLNRRVPDAIKHELHVLLVEHGKVYKNDVKALRKTCAELGAAGLVVD